MNWLLSPDGIAAIIQIFILIVLILTFLHAHRPHIGVVKVDSSYDEASKDFTVIISIKNTGNVPGNNIQANMIMFFNGKELTTAEGESRYVLFPSQARDQGVRLVDFPGHARLPEGKETLGSGNFWVRLTFYIASPTSLLIC